MNKPIYLGLSILEISKAVMFQFWYDYMKQKYQDKANPCYRDTDSLKVNIKTKHVCKAMATVLEKIEL